MSFLRYQISLDLDYPLTKRNLQSIVFQGFMTPRHKFRLHLNSSIFNKPTQTIKQSPFLPILIVR